MTGKEERFVQANYAFNHPLQCNPGNRRENYRWWWMKCWRCFRWCICHPDTASNPAQLEKREYRRCARTNNQISTYGLIQDQWAHTIKLWGLAPPEWPFPTRVSQKTENASLCYTLVSSSEWDDLKLWWKSYEFSELLQVFSRLLSPFVTITHHSSSNNTIKNR